ncbi:MAG: hypothetical protein Sapg2KO_03190 [Saprospiraceae bacterium]
MHQQIEAYDFAIFGGGLFGSYAALYLSRKGLKVVLIEKEKNLFTKASIVNQARLHGGYHYPRSVATAKMSDDNKARFTEEHRPFINFSFKKYYAIDRFGSLTDAAQFQRFCDFVKIPCRQIDHHPHISMRRLEALFQTEEYTFDPILIAQYYQAKIKESALIDIKLGTIVQQVEIKGKRWQLDYQQTNGTKGTIVANQVVNATYAASNTVNQLFDLAPIDLMHEISEMVLLSAPALGDLGLTVMDGQFASLMPYGKSGLWSLSSVAYTHHKVSYQKKPTFSCQSENLACTPNLPEDCNYCPARPISNKQKMIQQMRQYFKTEVDFHYFCSLFTIKSKLRANAIDDGRPTEIKILHKNPSFYCIFAGKINSIYEFEKVVEL